MSDDARFHEAARSVRAAAASLTPPDAAQARVRQQHQARARGAVAVVVVVLLVLAVAMAGRGGDADVTALSVGANDTSGANGSIGTTPGSAPDSVPGSLPVSVPGTTPGTTVSIPVPTTTAPTTTTTVDTGTTTSSQHVEGTYRGVGHYAVFTEVCPDISQTFDAVFQLADGGTWAYHTAFCASTDSNDVWRGAGPFTFTADDGATITGDFTSTAHLPTTGVPYSLQITGGTQRYATAKGSCAITIALREVQFGEQEQTGTFACDFTL